MRVGWEAKQVSKSHTPGGVGTRRARWIGEGGSHEDLEGGSGEVGERKGGTRHTSGVAQREREQKQDVGVSLIQHVDYILRDASCLGYLRITITTHIALKISKSQFIVTATTMMATSHMTPTLLTPPSKYVALLYST